MAKKADKPLIAAALGEKPSRYPVWFLRQAGRYLPEYMEVRSKVGFEELCRSPKLAAEVTIQPLRRYDLDASIIFSDILIPAVGMGQRLSFGKGHGPQLAPPVRSAKDLKDLRFPDCQKELGFVGEAIQKVKSQLTATQTMIGFAGAPLTVASYMIEGAGSKDYTELKRLAFTDRQTFTGLLELIGQVTIDYLKMQISAGAEVLMLFDSWAGALTPEDYRVLVQPITSTVISEVKGSGCPVIYFPGQGSDRMYELAGMAPDVIHVDWRVRLSRAAEIMRTISLDVALQGNLDPQVLCTTEQIVRERTREVLGEAKLANSKGHIFNVGHGLMPHLNPDALNWVIDEIRNS